MRSPVADAISFAAQTDPSQKISFEIPLRCGASGSGSGRCLGHRLVIIVRCHAATLECCRVVELYGARYCHQSQSPSAHDFRYVLPTSHGRWQWTVQHALNAFLGQDATIAPPPESQLLPFPHSLPLTFLGHRQPRTVMCCTFSDVRPLRQRKACTLLHSPLRTQQPTRYDRSPHQIQQMWVADVTWNVSVVIPQCDARSLASHQAFGDFAHVVTLGHSDAAMVMSLTSEAAGPRCRFCRLAGSECVL